ncbi:DUF2155 domain-containing protein [Azospirillum isscasi]|uniref:DUF2155 domain-containing protein n=1 Tax=Azospirillum isscasi TaxID=3053926 RepID=A0ABU0WBQ1_9PROT|nr:DUF2155 domain-containing protein [Azospirillum isscasi]MDQ2101592.1 DUF2155 domain-containing protein [Azospirillum isscasi]
MTTVTTTLKTLIGKSVCGAALAAALLGLAAPGLPGQAAAAPVPEEMVSRPAAKLQGLDKITARTSTFTIAVGETKALGSLRITLRACKENPPIEPPEAAAFLEVIENKPGEQAEAVFSGWMFASSPALSAMEHPIYDVWVLSCEGN